MPKLSWVLPTRNRLEWIGESLQSLLTQSCVHETEIIVVNDASDDGTKEFLDEWASQYPEVKIIHNEKQMGGGKSRNIGMQAATAEIIGICDDDDINVVERGDLILDYFEHHPEAELVTFPYQAVGYFNEKIEDFEGRPFDYDAYDKERPVYYCNPSSAYRKKAMEEIGGFGEETKDFTDDRIMLDNWIKAGKKVDFCDAGMVTLHRTLPDSMMTKFRGWDPKVDGSSMNAITETTTKEQLIKEYEFYPAVEGSLEEKPFYEHRYAPIFYEVPKGSHLLDVGCNDGTFMEMLRDKRQCDVKGIDISQIALDEAVKKKLDVRMGDAENIPFKDETFDVVNCQEVLSHLFDPTKAIKEMRRVLKKNGILLGSVPHENLQRYAWEDKRMVRKYFTVDELSQLLDTSFERNWIKVLTGAQFSMNMAESFLGPEPCEMLFKSGRQDTLGWDSELQDKAMLRCWFGFTQSPGTVYYRMSGFADKMQKLGAETHYNPYSENVVNSCSEWAEKIKWLPSQRRFTNQHIVDQIYTIWKACDISIWQIVPTRDVLALLTALRDPLKLHPLHPKKPLWLEMDDWMFDLPASNIASNPYHPNSENEMVAFDQLKLADGVITSTQYIKEKLAEIAPGKTVYVVKNSLDFEIWDKLTFQRPAHELNKDLIRIIYTGCGNHSGDLEVIKKPLLALLEEFPNLEFISLPFKCFDDVQHPRLIKWDAWVPLNKFPQMMANWEGDIGVAPLRDNEFNRAKSNLRWLEYSALKIPTIASNIYPFVNSIKNGKDGIVIGNNAKTWYDTMKELILNKEKRTKIGESAYKKVRKDYDMDDEAAKYLSILKSIKQSWLRERNHA